MELEDARKSRLGLLARVKEIALPDIAGGLEELKRRIAEQFQGQAQAAFFRKLEAVESKEDLRSLLEDAHLLDALSEESGDVRAEAE